MSVNHSVKCGTKDNSMYEFDRAVRDLKLNRSDKTCAAVNRHLKVMHFCFLTLILNTFIHHFTF